MPSLTPVADTGLLCLVALCRFHHIAVEPAQLAREFAAPGALFSVTDLQRAAKHLGLRCHHQSAAYQPAPVGGEGGAQRRVRLPNHAMLPAIFRHREGHWCILARRDDDAGKLLIHDVRQPQPQVLDEAAFLEIWNGELLLLTRQRARWLSGAEASGAEANRLAFDIRWFIPVLLKYKKLFGDVLLASFFLQLFALATPLFFQVVMDKVLVHHGMSTLDVLALGFLVVIVFETALGGIRQYVFAHTTNRVDVELGSKLFRHLLGLPLAYFQARTAGDSVARVRELDSLRQFITGSALTLVIDLSFTFVFLTFLLYYSVSLSLVVLASIPLYIFLSVLITPVLRARLDSKFQHSAINQSFLVESVTGAETVKSLALEPQLQRQWEDQLVNYVTSSFRAQHLNNLGAQAAGFINKLMTLGIIWWGAQLVMRGELSVGQLVAFNMLAGRISGPILKLVQLGQDFQQAKLSIDRLGDILNTPREPGFNPHRSTLPTLKGDVRFEHIRFRYRPDGPVILDGLNLHIRPGEVIGIVGQSGSGKSTLTKLVQRLYVPEAGRILIDGTDLSTVDTAWLRKHIGVVLQESFLFRRSVRENIAIHNPAIPMEHIVRAAQLAGAHEFISALPHAYDTLIEEHGANLSGGQRQRIAVARALINNPKILILDEATSALDYESERAIQHNMAAICQQRTVFIIAHRLSTVRGCHRIIVLDKGRLIEQGTHEQLLNKNGYYARLYGYQSEVVSVMAE